jgi:hypothetical protein
MLNKSHLRTHELSPKVGLLNNDINLLKEPGIVLGSFRLESVMVVIMDAL